MPTDTDWFIFSADSGIVYTVVVAKAYFDVEFRLFNASAETELARYESYDEDDISFDWACTETGDYIVQMLPAWSYGDCGNYGISIISGPGLAKTADLGKGRDRVIRMAGNRYVVR